MKHHIVGRYRGFVIEAHMQPRSVRSFNTIALAYRVTWSLRRKTRKRDIVSDFADAVIYESESIALTCVDREARAFIDAMLANRATHMSAGLLRVNAQNAEPYRGDERCGQREGAHAAPKP